MEFVKGWAGALCAVAIGCTVMQMLAPKDGMGRLFRILTAAFFLCCLTAPLLGLKSIPNLSLDTLPEDIRSDLLTEKVNEQLSRQVGAAVEGIAGQALKNYGLSAEKIETITDTSEDGSIYIKQIILYLDKQSLSQSAAVKQALEQRLGMTVDIAAA